VQRFEDAYDDVWRDERFVTTIQQRAGISWEHGVAGLPLVATRRVRRRCSFDLATVT